MDYNVLFEYNNVEKPYLLVRVYENGELINRSLINLNSAMMNDGIPENKELFGKNIDKLLETKNVNRNKALFLINCSQLTKITFTLPKLNDRKIKKLYDTEISNRLPDLDSYTRSSYFTENDKEKIYYEYLLNKKYVDYFKELGEQLGFAEVDFSLFSDYLFSNIKNIIGENTFCYFYEESGVTSLLTVINGALCSYVSFLTSDTNYNLYLTSTVDNHYLNLEKVKVEHFQANKEIGYLNNL